MKAKHQRLTLVVLAVVAIVAAGLIAAWTLRNQANYFYLPEQMASAPPAVGQPVRLGGMVQPGSLNTRADGISVSFRVTGNGPSTVPVQYSGILPDLVRRRVGSRRRGKPRSRRRVPRDQPARQA